MAKDILEKVEDMSSFLVLGIPEMDLQHEKFFKLLEELRVYLKLNEEDIFFSNLLEELEAYAVYHFKTEENIMRKNDYPAIESHISQHQLFKDKVYEFKHAMEYGNAIVRHQMLDFFQKWFVAHLCNVDHQLANYLKSLDTYV
jgi:hemerythrin